MAHRAENIYYVPQMFVDPQQEKHPIAVALL